MQYFGYLRRNPNDAPDPDFRGFDFWLWKLNQFNGNFVNAEIVKAFITSIDIASASPLDDFSPSHAPLSKTA